MWTLIIVAVMVAGQSSGGHAISVGHVPNFTTRESCLVAGNLLVRSRRTSHVNIDTFCVKDR